MRKTLPPSDALLAAIRAKCLDCNGNQRGLVELCKSTDCPLHPYRSIKAIGADSGGMPEIRGQIDLFETLTTSIQEQAI